MEREQACDNGMLKRRKKHEIRDRTEEGGGGERFVMDGWDCKGSQAFQIVTGLHLSPFAEVVLRKGDPFSFSCQEEVSVLVAIRSEPFVSRYFEVYCKQHDHDPPVT